MLVYQRVMIFVGWVETTNITNPTKPTLRVADGVKDLLTGADLPRPWQDQQGDFLRCKHR